MIAQGESMNSRAVTFACVTAVLSWPAHAQTERGPFIEAMRQSVEQTKARGEPADRCSLGFQAGDDGRVLLVFANTQVKPGDVIKTINAVSLQGKGARQFSNTLRGIGPTAVVPVQVERGGTISLHQMTCANARSYNGVLAAAQEAASKKDFKACVAQMRTLPPTILSQWNFRYTAVNCAMHAKSISKSEEVDQVYGWVDALVREATFVAEERDMAVRAVQSSGAYFNQNGRSDLHSKLAASLDGMYKTAGLSRPTGPSWGKFRQTAEAQIRGRLVDPDSAQFEWPHGFTYGTWKPFLSKRVEGYWTCGRVNARNRMGGYTGSTAFVVVMPDESSVTFVDIGDATSKYDLLQTQCEKSVHFLPPAPPELTQAGVASQPLTSIADEIEKLAGLRDRGILSQAEFEAQKAALLRGSH